MIGGVFEDDAMEEEDDLFRKIRDIARCLGRLGSGFGPFGQQDEGRGTFMRRSLRSLWSSRATAK